MYTAGGLVIHSVQSIIITNYGGDKHFVLCNYNFREDCAPATSKTDSDTPLLVLDVDNKKEDDSTARSRIEYLVPDPGKQHPNHVPSQRPTTATSRKHTVFLEYPTKSRSEDDNFYVGDQPAKIIGTNDEVIHGFVVLYMCN